MILVQEKPPLSIFRHSAGLAGSRAQGKILLMRHNGVGELIITTPFLHHLRERFPDHWISLLATPFAADLFKHCTDVDELLILEHGEEKTDYRSVLPALRGMAFDLFFSPQDIKPAAVIGHALSIPMRVGFNHHENGVYFTHPVDVPQEIHKTHKMLYLLSPFTPDIDGLTRDLHLFTSAEDVASALHYLRMHGLGPDSGFIGLNVGGQAYKQWPLDRVVEIGREVEKEFGAPCIVFAGNEENEEEIDSLARSIGGRTVVAYNLPLLQAAEILRRCRFVLTNDSGLSWLAAAVRTPSVILFRASGSMTEYKPEGDRHLGIQAYRDPTDFTDTGIRKITVQDVRDGIQALRLRLQSNDQRAIERSSEAFFRSYDVLNQSRSGTADNFKGPLHSCRSESEFSESKDYVRRILSGEVLVHRVRLDIARICKFRCSFCFSSLDTAVPADVDEQCIPLEMIQSLCAGFVRLGVRIVNLYGGGEPSLHPQMTEILRMLAEAGVRIRIISNGSGLSAELRDALIRYRSHIDIVRFSLPGLSCNSHREMTRSRLFDLITSSIQEFAREAKRHQDAPEIGIYVPVFMAFQQDEIADFMEYAARSAVDWLFFREDTRYPSKPGSSGLPSDPCAFPGVREAVRRRAKAYPEFPVYYSTPIAVPNATSVCYFQLTDVVLCYHSPARSLVMVRCEHHIPGGITELPAAGSYRLIEPTSLFSECEMQIREFLSNRVQVCPRPDYCLTYRRNLAIQDRLIAEGNGACAAGSLSQTR